MQLLIRNRCWNSLDRHRWVGGPGDQRWLLGVERSLASMAGERFRLHDGPLRGCIYGATLEERQNITEALFLAWDDGHPWKLPEGVTPAAEFSRDDSARPVTGPLDKILVNIVECPHWLLEAAGAYLHELTEAAKPWTLRT